MSEQEIKLRELYSHSPMMLKKEMIKLAKAEERKRKNKQHLIDWSKEQATDPIYRDERNARSLASYHAKIGDPAYRKVRNEYQLKRYHAQKKLKQADQTEPPATATEQGQ